MYSSSFWFHRQTRPFSVSGAPIQKHHNSHILSNQRQLLYAQVVLLGLLLQSGLNFPLFLRYQLLLVKNIHVRLGRFGLRDPEPPARFPYGKRGGIKINAAAFGASPGQGKGDDTAALPRTHTPHPAPTLTAAGRPPGPVRRRRPRTAAGYGAAGPGIGRGRGVGGPGAAGQGPGARRDQPYLAHPWGCPFWSSRPTMHRGRRGGRREAALPQRPLGDVVLPGPSPPSRLPPAAARPLRGLNRFSTGWGDADTLLPRPPVAARRQRSVGLQLP